MILVKIELHSARTGKVTELGRMQISNTGHLTSHTPNRGDYIVELFRKGSTTKVQRKGLVRDYPRLSYTVWELVRRSLESALGKWPIHPGRPEEFDEEVREANEKHGCLCECDQCLHGGPTRPSNHFTLENNSGFRLGKAIEPGVVSEEFKQKCRDLGLEVK
jgi:hypothetical protein